MYLRQFPQVLTLLKGTYSGSRLPWQFRFDLRVDKDIYFNLRKPKEGKEGKQAYLNVYFQILNVLNTKNVVNVYPYTGNADDDGYLVSTRMAASDQQPVGSRNHSGIYIAYM